MLFNWIAIDGNRIATVYINFRLQLKLRNRTGQLGMSFLTLQPCGNEKNFVLSLLLELGTMDSKRRGAGAPAPLPAKVLSWNFLHESWPRTFMVYSY